MEMQNEYKRLFKSISMSTTQKKKNSVKNKRVSKRMQYDSGGRSAGGGGGDLMFDSSQSDMSDGFLSNSDGVDEGSDTYASTRREFCADNHVDGLMQHSTLIYTARDAPAAPAVYLRAPSGKESSAALDANSNSASSESARTGTDWDPASQSRSPYDVSGYSIMQKSYAMRDIQMLSFMLHNKRFELLNDAITLWKGFVFYDRQARPNFVHAGVAARQEHYRMRSSPQPSGGSGGGIRKWLQLGYKSGINNANLQREVSNPSYEDRIAYPHQESSSLNALMCFVNDAAKDTL